MRFSRLFLAVLLIFSLTTPTKAHDVNEVHGYVHRVHDWYDSDCCSKSDCRPIESCSEIEELTEGRVKWNGYIFRKDNVRPSKDSKCHFCITGWKVPMCAYIQQGS